MKKLKVTAVSYLNTKPLLFGIFKNKIANEIDIQLNIPSVCAQKLLSGEAELGLVPVAIIPSIKNARIISDFCIGTNGAVKTVCIYGDVPIEKMDTIYLDFHSKTSVELTKYLFQYHWKLNPKFIDASEGYLDEIKGNTGGLVIGDRTIGLENKFTYIYDLGLEWKKHTGLPFVFAAWVSNIDLPQSFIEAFNIALKSGIDDIPHLVNLLYSPQEDFNLEEYFTHYISYDLDVQKRKALALFLHHLSEKGNSKAINTLKS